jgi:hypothetical protein
MSFPIEQWFDPTKRVPKYDIQECAAQMMLYAIKDGLDPDSEVVQQQVRDMKRAVRAHNKKFTRKTKDERR